VLVQRDALREALRDRAPKAGAIFVYSSCSRGAQQCGHSMPKPAASNDGVGLGHAVL